MNNHYHILSLDPEGNYYVTHTPNLGSELHNLDMGYGHSVLLYIHYPLEEGESTCSLETIKNPPKVHVYPFLKDMLKLSKAVLKENEVDTSEINPDLMNHCNNDLTILLAYCIRGLFSMLGDCEADHSAMYKSDRSELFFLTVPWHLLDYFLKTSKTHNSDPQLNPLEIVERVGRIKDDKLENDRTSIIEGFENTPKQMLVELVSFSPFASGASEWQRRLFQTIGLELDRQINGSNWKGVLVIQETPFMLL